MHKFIFALLVLSSTSHAADCPGTLEVSSERYSASLIEMMISTDFASDPKTLTYPISFRREYSHDNERVASIIYGVEKENSRLERSLTLKFENIEQERLMFLVELLKADLKNHGSSIVVYPRKEKYAYQITSGLRQPLTGKHGAEYFELLDKVLSERVPNLQTHDYIRRTEVKDSSTSPSDS